MNLFNLFSVGLLSMAFNPTDYDSNRNYLDEFLIPSISSLVSYSYGQSFISYDDNDNAVSAGDIWIPFYCRWNYTNNTPFLESVDTYVCHTTSTVIDALGPNYAFSYVWDSTSRYAYFTEYNYSALRAYGYPDIANGTGQMSYVSTNVTTYSNGVTAITTCYSCGENYHTWYMSSTETMEAITPWYWNICVSLSNTATESAYQQGWDKGYEEGERVGHYRGYQEGVEDTGEGGILSNLFGGVISVPISILNGLTPLVIWNVPIISIILTFLILGTLIFIIKRFV